MEHQVKDLASSLQTSGHCGSMGSIPGPGLNVLQVQPKNKKQKKKQTPKKQTEWCGTMMHSPQIQKADFIGMKT